MFAFYGLAIVTASYILRIFVQLNFIAIAWEEIIYWYNDNHLFSFKYNRRIEVHMLVCEVRVTSFSC